MENFRAIRVLVTSVYKFRARRQIVNLFAPGKPHEGDCSRNFHKKKCWKQKNNTKMQKMKISKIFKFQRNFNFIISFHIIFGFLLNKKAFRFLKMHFRHNFKKIRNFTKNVTCWHPVLSCRAIFFSYPKPGNSAESSAIYFRSS